MREILFRGKRIDNGEWVEGKGVDLNYSDAFILVGWRDESVGACEVDEVEVDRKSVGEYTGRTDRNGERIFEGDIGRYKQTDGAKRNGKPIICTGKVVYWAKTASYAVESKDEAGCKYFDYFPINDFEIIGNIHDNPELLEGGDGS